MCYTDLDLMTSYFFSSATIFCWLWVPVDSVLLADLTDVDGEVDDGDADDPDDADGEFPFADGATVFSLATEFLSSFVPAAI